MGEILGRNVHPLYAVMAFMSALIVLIMLISVTINRKGIKKNHKLILYWVLIFCIQDGIWGLFASHIIYNDTCLFLTSNVFHIFAIFSAFVWTLYFLSRIKERPKYCTGYIVFSVLVVLIQLGLLAANLSSKFMFYVDENGWYQTTNYRSILFYFQFATYIFIGIVSLVGTAREEVQEARGMLWAIFFVNLSPLLFGVFQLIYPDAPANSIGFSFACIIIELFLSKDTEEQVYSLEQMKEQLNDALCKAEAANRAKTSFLFSMSHDIRTPMNAILGFTRIAEKHINDQERVQDSLNKIRTSGSQLLNIINEVLEMSRIESGKIEIVEVPADIRNTMDDIEPMLFTAALSKSIDYNVLFGTINNRYVWADIVHLERVLVNIVSNAIKYTPDGGRVSVLVEQLTDPADGMAEYSFTMKDNGIGISKEFMSHLFEEFAREHTSTVSKQEGTGLGLPIAQRITELMGGKIEVESKVGKGSTFMLTVPLRVMSEEEAKEYFGSQDEVAAMIEDKKKALCGKKVLLVEDNQLNREIATDILEDLGLTVTVAEDGALAVDIVEQMCRRGILEEFFDYILMDIQMPVMNGYEATKKIRRLDAMRRVHIPIIAMTANAFSEDKKMAYDCGMDAHMAKPVSENVLIETLSKFNG